MGRMVNRGSVGSDPAPRYEDMDEVSRAKADMDYQRRSGNAIGYRQAKAHYRNALRRARRKGTE